MPNGNPNFDSEELPQLEAFFAPLTPTLERFATHHNLAVDKYYHQLPSWEFRFRHPKGGEAYVEVRRADDSSIRIAKAWWQDDYDRATRSMKMTFSEPIRLDTIDLFAGLVRALREIVAWQPGCWDQVYPNYQNEWHRTWSKEQFDALLDTLPMPHVPDEA